MGTQPPPYRGMQILDNDPSYIHENNDSFQIYGKRKNSDIVILRTFAPLGLALRVILWCFVLVFVGVLVMAISETVNAYFYPVHIAGIVTRYDKDPNGKDLAIIQDDKGNRQYVELTYEVGKLVTLGVYCNLTVSNDATHSYMAGYCSDKQESGNAKQQ